MKIASSFSDPFLFILLVAIWKKRNNNTVTKEESVFELGQKCVSARKKMALGTD
jgi:hypothetical protein